MSLEHTLLNRLEARSMQLAQMKKEIHGLKLLVDEKMTINESLAAEVTRERETARANYEHIERQITGLRGECEQLRREVPLESTREALKNAVANLRQHKSDIAKLYELADEIGRGTDESIADVMKRLGDECARLAGKVAELEAQKSNASPIGYISKADYDAAVTAARENGIHKGESLSGFIWRQCEMLRKSQAENAPLNKVFIAICKQRGNLNEEIIYRAVDEASEEIRQLTA